MLSDDIATTIDGWINGLQQYSYAALCAQPSPGSWSAGQVYMHLISDTGYYTEQVKICLSANDNATEEASAFTKTIFMNNDFPDERIEGPPSNAGIPQPYSKEQLFTGLQHIKDEMTTLAIQIETGAYRGKTKHPGLGYFSAAEWLRFAVIHFRHHTRQQKRISNFLKINFGGQ